MINQDEHELETIETQELAAMYEALKRLEDNPDFKLVILDGYLKTKALDSVTLLADPRIKQQGARPDVMEDLVAISGLNYHLMMVKNLGMSALMDIADAEAPEVEE